MNHPTTSQLKEAFVLVAEAEDRLRLAKQALIDLHYQSEEVDNSRFLLENIGRVAPPSSDAQDVLFARKQDAEEALSVAFRDGLFGGMTEHLSRGHNALERAYRLLH